MTVSWPGVRGVAAWLGVRGVGAWLGVRGVAAWLGVRGVAVRLRVRGVAARLRSRLRLGRAGADTQAGSAVVEFVFLAVLMMVPLFYLVMVLARLQAGAFGVSVAAREAGRAYVTAEAPAQAPSRAHSAAGLAFADQGFERGGRIEIGCDGIPCLRPAGRVMIMATIDVPMPLVPVFFSGIVPMRIPVSATHVSTVDRFGGQ